MKRFTEKAVAVPVAGQVKPWRQEQCDQGPEVKNMKLNRDMKCIFYAFIKIRIFKNFIILGGWGGGRRSV
jgi:hypothetical protein